MLELVAKSPIEAATDCVEAELAQARVALEQERFARELADTARLRLERRIAELEDECAALRLVAEERARHVAAVLDSRSWRLIQAIRRLALFQW